MHAVEDGEDVGRDGGVHAGLEGGCHPHGVSADIAVAVVTGRGWLVRGFGGEPDGAGRVVDGKGRGPGHGLYRVGVNVAVGTGVRLEEEAVVGLMVGGEIQGDTASVS